MKKSFILLILFSTLSALTNIQFRLQGAAEPAGTTVMIDDLDLLLEADEMGSLRDPVANRSVFEIAAGTYTARMIMHGMEHDCSFQADQNDSVVDIIIDEVVTDNKDDVKKLKEIVIVGSKRSHDRSRVSISANQARLIPGTGGDPLLAMRSMPGVVVGSILDPTMYIRGGNGEDMLHLYDNMRIGNPFHVAGFYSVFHSSLLEKITFYPGSFTANFPNSQGGVLEMISRSSYEKDRPHGTVDINFGQVYGYLTVPLGESLQLSISGRRTWYEAYLEILKTMILSYGEHIHIKPFFYDYTAKLDMEFKDRHYIKISGIGSRDRIEWSNPAVQLTNALGETNIAKASFNSDDRWATAGATWKYLGGKLENQLTFSWFFQKADFDEQDDDSFDIRYNHLSLVDDFVYKFNDSIVLTTGLEDLILVSPFTTKDFKEGTDSFLTNHTLAPWERYLQYQDALEQRIKKDFRPVRNILTAYLSPEFSFLGFEIIPGLRMMHNNVSRQMVWDPRFQLNYVLAEKYNFFFKTGRYSQLPTDPTMIAEKFGTPSIRTPYAWHYTLGSEVFLGDYEIKLEGYYKDLRDQVKNNPSYDRFFANDDENNPMYVNTGKGTAWGLELMARKNFSGKTFGWLNYSLGHSRRRSYTNWINSFETVNINNGLDFRAMPMVWHDFEHDVRHSLGFVFYWKIHKIFSISTRLNLESGKPFTKYYTDYEDVDNNDSYDAAVDYLYLRPGDEIYGSRMPVKYSWNLRFDWMINIRNQVEINIYLDIWNLQWFWNKNVLWYTLDFSYVNKPGVLPGQELPESAYIPNYDLPCVPFLGVEARF